MTLFASMQIALEAIKTNKMRSFLTMLGIIIGVASVITMVSVGSGAQNRVEEQINSLGSKMLMVWPGSGFGRGRHGGAGTARQFSEEDVDSILNEVDGVTAASGELTTNGQLVTGNKNWASSIRGVQGDYMFIRDWFIQIGRNFSAREIRSAGKVVILGSTVAEELFDASNPIGQRIRIKNVPFNVIGVLAEKGQSSFGQDQDDVVFVPLATARNRLIGRRTPVARNVRTMYIKVGDDRIIGDVQMAMESLLRLRRDVEPGEEDNFRVRNLAELISARNETQRIFSILLGATASISLLVGGIGIMNIMLVSVTERTREIGLRLAVGARAKDVLTQFLVEATTISVIGGLIGIGIGVGASQLISRFADWPTLLGPEIIVISAIFSAFVGIFFGFYPARKASRLNPIDALRFE